MVVVERILSGQINKGLAAQLVVKGVNAVGLSCRDSGIIIGKPIRGLERAARPHKTNARLLRSLLKGGFLPVISSVASDQKGEAVNINADDAASAVAIALRADNLIFLTNVPGVFDQGGKRIPILKIKNVDRLIEHKVIQGGMIPKVQSARAAIQKGVHQITITNGKAGVKPKSGTKIIR
jgi:acetylglutamate kinase